MMVKSKEGDHNQMELETINTKLRTIESEEEKIYASISFTGSEIECGSVGVAMKLKGI